MNSFRLDLDLVSAALKIGETRLPATRKSGWPVGLALFCLLAWAAPSGAQQYTLTDLGTLPGDSVSKASALNDAGEAAGVSDTPTAAIATIFGGGKATNIDASGSGVSLANAINRAGEIAGWNSESNANFDPQAFLYSDGSIEEHQLAVTFPFWHRSLCDK